MVNYDSIANVSSAFGTAFSLFFFFSPIVLFIEVCKTNNIKKVPYLMLLCNCICTFIWTVYGLAGGGLMVWVCNGIGLIFNLTYVCWFWLYFFDKISLKVISISISIAICVGAVTLGIFANHNKSLGDSIMDPFGWAGMILNIFMYAAPGQKIIEVFKKGNHTYIPIVSCVVAVGNSIAWGLFSLTHFQSKDGTIDWFIFVPNGLGLIFSIFQVVLWLVYYCKNNGKEPTGEEDGERNDYLMKTPPTSDIEK